MNKFKKADIFKATEKRIAYWEKLKLEDVNKLIVNYSKKARKGFLGLFKRDSFVPSEKEAVYLYDKDNCCPISLHFYRDRWIADAKNFLEYVAEANGLDSDYVYLTEAQYEEWG